MDKNVKKLLILMVAVAAALRLYRIGYQSLWVDEILTLNMSTPKPGLSIWDYLKYNIHGPAHSFVVYLFHFVSMSDGWLRLPSALAGIGAVIYFFRWISEWMGGRIALVASALLALNPMHIYYAQEMRNYSFLLFFAMMACFYFHRFLQAEEKPTLAYFCIATALAALSNFTAAFLFAAHTLIYFLHRGLRKASILRWITVCLIILVLISPWVYRIYVIIDVSKLVTPVMPGEISAAERLRGGTTVGWSAIPYGFYTLSTGFSLGPSLRFLHQHPKLNEVFEQYSLWIILVALIFGSTGIVGFYYFARERLYWREIALYMFIPIVFTMVLCWQNAKAFNSRYIILTLPAYLCVLANGLTNIRSRAAKSFFTIPVVILSLYSLGNFYFNGEYAKENVKAATRYIEEQMRADECIVAPKVMEVVDHYLHTPRQVHNIPAMPGTPKDAIDRRLDKIISGCGSLWYLQARPRADDFDEYVLGSLEAYYSIETVKTFEGVKLLHLVKRISTPGS